MKKVMLIVVGLALVLFGSLSLAAGPSGVGAVAAKITGNLANIARLITALSYVIGMALVVASLVKFKAHKDNPTQIPIGTPIALLFVGAALIFVPTVFSVGGGTLFGQSGKVAGVSGITSFGAPVAGT